MGLRRYLPASTTAAQTPLELQNEPEQQGPAPRMMHDSPGSVQGVPPSGRTQLKASEPESATEPPASAQTCPGWQPTRSQRWSEVRPHAIARIPRPRAQRAARMVVLPNIDPAR